MIDTVKIYCEIDKDTYERINNSSIVKTAINKESGELLYSISNAHLEGSYSSNLCVRVCCSSEYSIFIERREVFDGIYYFYSKWVLS